MQINSCHLTNQASSTQILSCRDRGDTCLACLMYSSNLQTKNCAVCVESTSFICTPFISIIPFALMKCTSFIGPKRSNFAAYCSTIPAPSRMLPSEWFAFFFALRRPRQTTTLIKAVAMEKKRKPGTLYCCVVGCSNNLRDCKTSSTSGQPLKFYHFPGRPYECERRQA